MLRDASLYFIQAGGDRGPIKIGFSVDPAKRCSDLQVGNHEALALLASLRCRDAQYAEKAIHEHLSSSRMNGEWFRFSVETAAIVRAARALSSFALQSKPLLPESLRTTKMSAATDGEVWVAEWSDSQCAPHIQPLSESLAMAWEVLLGGAGSPNDYTVLGLFESSAAANDFLDKAQPELVAMTKLRRAINGVGL